MQMPHAGVVCSGKFVPFASRLFRFDCIQKTQATNLTSLSAMSNGFSLLLLFFCCSSALFMRQPELNRSVSCLIMIYDNGCAGIAACCCCCCIMHMIRPQQGGDNNNFSYNNNCLQLCQVMQKCKTLSALVLRLICGFFIRRTFCGSKANRQRCKQLLSEVSQGSKEVQRGP